MTYLPATIQTKMASDDEDVPETGAVFTFGKSRFADNLASKFWIRDDPVVQVACGDEHSAIITAKGKLYTFGSNDWGQLGHGNTKPYNKPSVVKRLKPEKSYLVACGRNHTLVATESGRLYSFGCGEDGQLGHEDSEYSYEPKAIELLDSQQYSILACGSDFSAAVTENGILYTWGSSSEGQNGLGEDTESPKRLYLSGKVVSVACGYYHMAVVTDDGSLYTCGEKEGGKLGLEKSQLDDTSQLQKVESIKEKVTAVSCGAEFTVAVTQNGQVYSFGQGNQGELGLGPALMECELPEKVQTFNKVKAKSVDCGGSFTSIITKHGNLYTFGDGRHGKLGLGDECFSNLFTPQKVTRFNNFIVKKVSCGGCHMLASAVRKEESVEESDSEEQAEKETLATTLKPGQLLDAVDGPSHLSSTWSARDKRRQKHVEDINNSLSHSLPPINKSSLPPLNGTLKRTLPVLGKGFLNEEEKKPVNPLNASKLPKITHPDEEEDNQATAISKSSPTSSPKPLPRGLAKPSPLAAPRILPRTRKEKEETESEEESGSEEESDEEEEAENGNGGKIKKEGMMKTGESENEVKKQVKKEEEESEEDEEESETEEDEDERQHSKQATVKDKTTKTATTAKEVKKEEEEKDEEESEEDEEDDDEEEDDNKSKKKIKDKKEDKTKTKSKRIEVESSAKKGEKDSEEEEGDDEEDEEEDKDVKKKKKDLKEDRKDKKKKGKKKSKDEDEDEETDDKEAKEKNTEKTKKRKNKGKKKNEETKDEEDEEEDENEDKDKEKEKGKTDEDNKEGDSKSKESAKNTAKQKDKKSGICVII